MHTPLIRIMSSILLFIQLNINAQTLTAENFNPVISETIVMEYLDKINLLPNGQDSIWDYSFYKPAKTAYTSVTLPNNDTLLFPDSNCLLHIDGDNNSNPDHYLKTTPNALLSLGYKSGQYVHFYDPPFTEKAYPYYKGVKSEVVLPFSTNNDSSVIRTVVDATGTLTTCYNIYTNTLRVYEYIEQFISTTKIIAEIYKWYSPGIHTEILVVRKSTRYLTSTSSETNFSNYVYRDPQIIETDTLGEDEIIVYPIPTKSFLYIKTKGAKLADLEIQIYSLTGVQMNLPHEPINANEIRINVESVSSGTYLLKVFKQQELIKSIKVIKL